MACLLNNHIKKGCKDNVGGIKKVYLANKDLLTSVAIGTIEDYVETLTTQDSVANSAGTYDAAPAFYEFQPNKASSNWTDTGSQVSNNGGTFYTPSVTMIFSKNDAAKITQIKIMGQTELVAIVVQNDGKVFLTGADLTTNDQFNGNGLEVTSATYASGTAYTDGTSWTVTLAGGENHPAYEIDPALLTDSILVD
jgi:hypothetical protein